MKITSRYLALLLATSVAGVTVAFLSLLHQTDSAVLVVAAGISFSSCFFLSYFLLRFLIFKEIHSLYKELGKLRGKKAANVKMKQGSFSTIKRIEHELNAYATQKEEEISQLRQMEVYRREFLADVSHELKTPIFAAQGYILTLLDGAIDDDKVRSKFLRRAAKSLSGLDALVQDLLTITHLESGFIKLNFESFDLHMLVIDIIDQLEGKASKRDIKLKVKAKTEEAAIVHADYNRISQVLTNLITNGIKYNNEGGMVEVLLEDLGDAVKTTVIDNGYGIPEEHMNRVFERFYRVEKSRSKKQGGSGLGLAIVKHILENHNATIELESNLGKGTRFSFTLLKPNIDASNAPAELEEPATV